MTNFDEAFMACMHNFHNALVTRPVVQTLKGERRAIGIFFTILSDQEGYLMTEIIKQYNLHIGSVNGMLVRDIPKVQIYLIEND